MQSLGGRLAVLALGAAAIHIGAAAAAEPVSRARPTNLPGVTTSAPPPEHFDAVHASDEDLASYGFPPRPTAATATTAYTNWASAVGAQPERLMPRLLPTAVYHGPRVATFGTGAFTSDTSSNWSGYAVRHGAVAWSGTSFDSISADFIVPAVAARTCNNTWEYASSWIGLDGYASRDVLQAGVEEDAECGLVGTQTYFSPWYEWYPNASTRIVNLTAAPGQSFYVHVWATGATAGHAYLQNLNTNQSVSLNFSAPSGTSLIGESAEWIVESPSVGGTLATLPGYGMDFFVNGHAITAGNVAFVPGSSGTIPITLVRNGITYSTPSLLGTWGEELTSH
jgi:hypothetical protein